MSEEDNKGKEVDKAKEEKLPIWGKLDDPRKPADLIGHIKRTKTFFSRPCGEVELTEYESIDCDGAPILQCFPSIGYVSVMAGKQIVKTLKLPLVGIIRSEHFQVSCVVQDEQPSHPARVYGNKDLVVFICEMSMKLPPEVIRSVVDCIFDFAHRHRSPMIYTIEGTPKTQTLELPTGEEIQLKLPEGGGEQEEEIVPDERLLVIDDSLLAKLTLRDKAENEKNGEAKTEEKEETTKSTAASPSKSSRRRKGKKKEDEEEKGIEDIADEMFGKLLHYVTTDSELAKKLRALGHIPIVDGIVPGVTGGLLSKAILTDQEVTAILAPTSTIFPDPASAVPVLKLLHELLQPKVDLSKTYEDLEREGSDLEKMIRGLLAQGLAEKKQNVPFGIYG